MAKFKVGDKIYRNNSFHTDYEIHKNTILVNKKFPHIKLKVLHVSGRMFEVASVNDSINIGKFNYDHIWRHYNVMPLLKNILKEL